MSFSLSLPWSPLASECSAHLSCDWPSRSPPGRSWSSLGTVVVFFVLVANTPSVVIVCIALVG